MKAVGSCLNSAAFVLILNLCFNPSFQQTEVQRVCALCGGAVLNGSAVSQFCSLSDGQIEGRCCLRNDSTADSERVVGLDLSNCSLTQVDPLMGVFTAIIIDISLNPIVNMSDTIFQGFSELNYIILPQSLGCPGGNTSWEKVIIKEGSLICEGQKNICNQTGQLSMNCPENSMCAPYGPGFFECSCAENFHGYKCLREGEFPAVQVFWRLAAATVVLSVFLWATQRRKAKSL